MLIDGFLKQLWQRPNYVELSTLCECREIENKGGTLCNLVVVFQHETCDRLKEVVSFK